MKFAFNVKINQNSWGGGNSFLKIIYKFLRREGHNVYFDLSSKDLDAIFIIDPRSNNSTLAFPIIDVINYCLFKNNKTLIIHRINECNSKRYNSRIDIDNLLKKTNKFADHTIFVSKWLKNQKIWAKKNNVNSSVIMNGSDKKIYNTKGKKYWRKKDKFKIVTHQWSNNWNKGFGYYKKLDKLLDLPYWKSKIQFSFIGNLPDGLELKNTKIIKPLNEKLLASELKKHDGYITGSKFEPGSNHQNEAALCGLPLFYIDHSSMPEYCRDYGKSFNKNNFEKNLKLFFINYPIYKKKLKTFQFNESFVERKYKKLINKIKMNKLTRKRKNHYYLYLYFFADKLKFYFFKLFRKFINQ